MAKLILDKQSALDILYEENENAEVIVDDIEDIGRWSTYHTLIFKLDGDFYRTFYRRGATEYQDESPWEHDTEVTCEQVYPVQEMTTVYKSQEEIDSAEI